MQYANQYLILKDDGFLKENGKVTSTIERAYIFPTKKLAQMEKYFPKISESTPNARLHH